MKKLTMTIVSAVVAAFGLAAQTATVKVTYDSQAPNYKKEGQWRSSVAGANQISG